MRTLTVLALLIAGAVTLAACDTAHDRSYCRPPWLQDACPDSLRVTD